MSLQSNTFSPGPRFYPCVSPAHSLSIMALSHPNTHWDAPTFHFNSPNQSEDLRIFYMRAINYLDALYIETDQVDNCHKGWKQLKLMFKGNGRQALQTLIDNGTIMEESMKTPSATLDGIRTTIKSEDHFWAHRDDLLSDMLGSFLAREYMCSPSTFVTSSPNAGLPHAKTHEMLKAHGPATCSVIPQGQRLDLPAGPVPVHIPVPSLPLANCWNQGMQTVQESQG